MLSPGLSTLRDFFFNLSITEIRKDRLYYVHFANEEIKIQREFKNISKVTQTSNRS